MAKADFTIKANDTLPSISALLSYADGSIPDLAGTTITFVMAAGQGAPKVNAVATVTDAAIGKVTYDWLPADTDTPGDFIAEWEVVFPNGLGKQTFPTDGYHSVKIIRDVDSE